MGDVFAHRGPSHMPEEVRLCDYLHKLRDLKGFVVIHIHLTKLIGDGVKSQAFQVGLNTFEKYIEVIEKEAFKFTNGDVIYVFRHEAIEDMKRAAVKLRDIYSAKASPESKSILGDCFKVYDLDYQHDEFAIVTQQLLDRAGFSNYEKRYRKDEPTEALNLIKLDRIEKGLENVSLIQFIRQQPVCVIHDGQIVKTVFREFYVSIPDFQKQILPDTNIKSNILMFRYLTRLLDKRVLYSLEKVDQKFFEMPFSLNLNADVVVTPHFARFDKNVRTSVRGTISVELDFSDVFLDITAFIQAKKILRSHEYKFILDGVTTTSLPYINRDIMGFDLLKLMWHPAMADSEQFNLVENYLKNIKRETIILYRCDSPLSIEVGQKLGISMFQGLYVQYLQEKNKI